MPCQGIFITKEGVNMDTGFTVECNFKVPGNDKNYPPTKGWIPRVSKLMALALHFEELIRTKKVRDYADIAALGYVTRARLTQIMNLNLLSPDIQEKILFLPEVREGPDPITEHQIRKMVLSSDWSEQKKIWDKFMS